jgi:PAS domain S-box-containing protein
MALFVALAMLAAGLVLWWRAGQWYQGQLLGEARMQADVEMTLRANALAAAVNRRVALLQGLSAFVQSQVDAPRLDAHFAAFAAGLHAGSADVRSLAVAPGGVVRWVYPPSGNEDLLGYEPNRDPRPEVSADVARAIQTRQVILTGLIELTPGESGLMAWQAVYRGDAYWGLVGVAMDVPPLLEEAALGASAGELDFVLRDRAGRLIYGAAAVLEGDPVMARVELPDGAWDLAAMPGEGWLRAVQRPLFLFQGAGFVIATLLAGLAFLWVNRHARLVLAVQQRTEEITRVNQQLQSDIATRQRIESELRVSEERYRTLARNFPNGAVILFDRDLRYVLADGAGLAEVGLSKELLEGRTIWELFPPDTCAVLEPHYRAALAGGSGTFEVAFADRVYLLYTLPIRDERGGVVAGMAMTQDITARKEAEEALRDSEARLRALVDAIPDIMLRVSRDGTYLDFHAERASDLLLPPESLIGSNLRDTSMPPELVAQALHAIETAIGTGEMQTLEYALAMPDGLRHFEARHVASGEAEVVITVRDITERKRAEAELARWAHIFEHAEWGVAVGRADRATLEIMNPAYARMHGYTVAELMHQPIQTVYAPGADADLDRLILTADTQGHAVMESTHLRKDGSTFPVLVDVTSVKDDTGRLLYRVANVQDITERKMAEARLKEKEEQYRSVFEATSDGLFINDLNGNLVDFNPAAAEMHGYTVEAFRALQPPQFIHPDSLHLFAEYMETVRAGGVFRARAVDVRKDGSLMPIEVLGTSFTYRGEPHTLAVVRDITEQVQALELLEQRVEERTRELTTLLDISRNVASTLELQPLLGLILDQLRVVVDYTGAAVLTLEGEALVVKASRGPISEETARGYQFSLDHALDREIIFGRRPIIIPNVRGDTRWAHAFREAAGEHLETFFRYIRSWMGVPLVVKDQAIGMLSLDHRQENHYSEKEAELAMAFGVQAAVAIENARLYEQARSLAALEERQKLARELHDSVSQAIYGIALGARTARTQLERDPSQAAEPLDYVLSLAEAGLAEMRALIFELRPESLQLEGLVAALTKQAASVRARHHLDVQMQLAEEPELALEAKEALYRIAQEALHNTVKHARARRVDIRLDRTEQAVTLELRDDGVGFEADGSFPGHLGLRSMRERAARLGGKLEVESAPGQGSLIRARIPVR